jgi:hypothetical protein
MGRNSDATQSSGVQRRHFNPRISVVSLHNISVDIHIHYSTSRQIKSKYSEKHKGEKS